MLYLFLAICSSGVLSVLMRLSERKIGSKVSLLVMNYLTCSVVAACFVGGGLKSLPGPSTLGLGLLGGALFLLSFALLQRSVSRNGVVLSSTFMKLGVLISIGVSVVVFGERPTAFQAVGVALAVAAIIVINGFGGGGTGISRSLLCLLLLFGGLADAMSKIFEELGNPLEEGWFLLSTFLAAWVMSLVWMVWKKERPGLWETVFGILIGIPNYFSSLFFLWALETVSAVVAFPVFNVGAMLVVCLAGVLLFREKLNRRQWAGIGIIALALTLLNL